jgi:sn-glycerol 3-phosphate transport system substrate-binding protein
VTKIIFWHAFEGRNQDIVNKLIADFEAIHPDIDIEPQYQGNYDDAFSKLKATQKGQLPDVMQIYDIGTRWAVDSGLTLKMQDFINRDRLNVSDYEPNILAYYTLDGELYSMPFNCSSPVLLYNKEAVAKAGLDPEKAFATLDDCLASARAIKAAGLEVGGSFTNYSWVIEQLVGIQGADLLDNGNGRKERATKVVAETPLLNILTKYKSYAGDPATRTWGKGTGESKTQFATGSVGFILDSCSIYANISSAAQGKFTVGYAPVPKVNASDKGGVSVGGGSLWLMDNGAKDRENAAWEFIKFVTTPEKQAEFASGTGYLPTSIGAVNLPLFQDYMKTTNPAVKVAIDALHNSTPTSAGSVMAVVPKARVIIENEIENMTNNASATPQAAVTNIITQIGDEITLYNRTNR